MDKIKLIIQLLFFFLRKETSNINGYLLLLIFGIEISIIKLTKILIFDNKLVNDILYYIIVANVAVILFIVFNIIIDTYLEYKRRKYLK